MNAAQIAQVANHLNVSPNQVKEVQEWANVLFVKFTKGSPRFVSKKVVKTMPKIKPVDLLGMPDSWIKEEKAQDELADKAHDLAMEIHSHLSIDVSFHKLKSAAIEILEGETTFNEVVSRFNSKKIIIKKK